MSNLDEWLDTHAIRYYLYDENNQARQLDIPARQVYEQLQPPHQGATYDQTWEHSRNNAQRTTHANLVKLLKSFSGPLPFHDFDHVGPVGMEVKSVETKADEQAQPSKPTDGWKFQPAEESHQETEELNMPKKGMKNMLLDAGKEGLKEATVNQGGEVLLDTFKKLAGDNEQVQALLENQMGRELIKAVMAMGLFYASEEFPNVLPKADKLKGMSEIIVRNSARQVVEPNMALIIEQIKLLGELGDDLPDFDFEEDSDAAALDVEDVEMDLDFSEEEQREAEKVVAESFK